jgi:hypothetical protein
MDKHVINDRAFIASGHGAPRKAYVSVNGISHYVPLDVPLKLSEGVLAALRDSRYGVNAAEEEDE